MVRIKVSGKTQSDVTEMRAKGWHVCIYRDTNPEEEMITAEKKDIRFTVKPKTNEHGRCVEVRKYVMGYQKDSKTFYDVNCGINGTLCISEGKNNDDTYAFFRNEALQNLLDDFNIRRVIFPREGGTKFEKDVYLDVIKARQAGNYSDAKSSMPPFHTDGTYEEVGSESKGLRKWHVVDATYIYEYGTSTLTIPQEYDLNKIADNLEEIIDN